MTEELQEEEREALEAIFEADPNYKKITGLLAIYNINVRT